MIETVKRVFDENGIVIPFNQLDVYVKEQIKEQN
jgi:small-conductance mechanosensitive channel